MPREVAIKAFQVEYGNKQGTHAEKWGRESVQVSDTFYVHCTLVINIGIKSTAHRRLLRFHLKKYGKKIEIVLTVVK